MDKFDSVKNGDMVAPVCSPPVPPVFYFHPRCGEEDEKKKGWREWMGRAGSLCERSRQGGTWNDFESAGIFLLYPSPLVGHATQGCASHRRLEYYYYLHEV